MSRLECQCGGTIRDQDGAAENIAAVFPQSTYDDFLAECGKAITGYLKYKEGAAEGFEFADYFYNGNLEENFGSMINSISLRYGKNAMECECCGRVYIQGKYQDHVHVSYKPENDIYNGVLGGERAQS